MKLDLKYLRWAALRQMPLIAVTIAVLMTLTILTTYVIPSKHKAQALLLVEAKTVSQKGQITSDALTDAAHLQNIENRLLTQTRLAAMSDALATSLSVDQLRAAIQFDAVSGRGKATTLTISVKATDPQFAVNATNMLADKVVAEHRAIRTERAETALQFFRSEVTENKARLDEKLAELMQFKTAVAGATLDTGQTITDQRDAILAQLNATPITPAISTEHKRVLTQIDAARAVYSERHPKMQLLLSKLAKFETSTQNPVELDHSLAQELTRIDTALSAIPANELLLSAVERDYKLAEAQYESAIGRLEAAAIEERIAARSNGDRLTIIERATLPEFANGPKQRVILTVGFLLSVLLAISFAILKARTDPYLRRAEDLETGLGLKAYAVIPTMQSSQAGI